MTFRLFAPAPTSPLLPRLQWMELSCDGDHGFLGAPSVLFRQNGYLAQRTAAVKAGWKILSDPEGRGYLVFCAGCAKGKKDDGE